MIRRVVGILGGMGPEATILLQQRLLAEVSARDDADHLPLLIDMNPQVPSRIAHLIDGTGPDPAPTLAEMARRLEASGASALAMPCNTAHHYAPQIAAAVSIPLLNMVDLSIAVVTQRVGSGAKVGFLASPAVRKAGVFDAALVGAGLGAIWPGDMGAMLATIRSIKANGASAEALDTLTAAADEMARGGADVILVACSEFSLLSQSLVARVPVIDTVDVLTRAIRDHIIQK
ncbi:MAG: aspartate/glutamate racemase family protein [Rhodobacteraceae bacterium]|nr:aspartate/glutamate racemase family protein [Paracoccaceae bacterium]